MKRESVTHQFVELIPDTLEEGVVYISIEYATAMHLCCCGCGREVSTQLSPTDWRLTFDGRTISLCPSIGRWSWPCQAHYWIEGNRVRWAGPMLRGAIEAGRARERAKKAAYFAQDTGDTGKESPLKDLEPAGESLWSRLRRRLSR